MAEAMGLLTRDHLEQPKVALERVTSFKRHYGRYHFALACHAALPLTLTPDLLEQLWANFTPQTPWVAIADVLLSRLCHEVGHETYEMWPHTRELLLEELKDDAGEAHVRELSLFVRDYVRERLTGNPSDTEANYQARIETMNALFYSDPNGTQAEQAMMQMAQDPATDPFRMLGLVERLSAQLGEKKAEVVAQIPSVEEMVSVNLSSAVEENIRTQAKVTASGIGAVQAENATAQGHSSVTSSLASFQIDPLAEAARLTQVRNLIAQSFNLEEMKTLCFDLKVEYENLEGEAKTARATSLVRLMSQRDELKQLVDACIKERRPRTEEWQFPGLRPTLRKLAAAIAAQFDQAGLHELFLTLGIATHANENTGDAQQLVLACMQLNDGNGGLNRLVALLKERRSNVDWDAQTTSAVAQLPPAQFRQGLVHYFDLDELASLHLELGEDSHNNNRTPLQKQAERLIEFCVRHELLSELGVACELARPMVNWTAEALQTAQVKSLPELRRAIEEAFSLEDLNQLSADLKIDFEELSGNTRIAKTHSLLTYLQHRDQLPNLIDQLKRLRPKTRNWDGFLEQPAVNVIAETENVDVDALSKLIARHFKNNEIWRLTEKLDVDVDELGWSDKQEKK